MIRHLTASAVLSGLLALALLPAEAQYSDPDQGLFESIPLQPQNEDNLINIEITDKDESDVTTGNSGAQTVEEVCCKMPEDERLRDGLCFDVVCPEGQLEE